MFMCDGLGFINYEFQFFFCNRSNVYFAIFCRFRGKKEVRKSAKYEMSYEEEVASLVIHKTEPDDADVYRCEVSNPLGKVQTEGTLIVHSKLSFFSFAAYYILRKRKKNLQNWLSFINKASSLFRMFKLYCV